jgi:glycosyltransferase involved in cell wall biosynthesis
MKIYFDNVNWEAEHTGPSSFAKRLAIQLGNMGHQLADPDDYDIALVFIEPTDKLNLKKPFVQRLDGIWFKPEQMNNGMNSKIEYAFDKASSVIWQSEFDREMTQKYFGKREGVVIPNGIEIKRAAVKSEQLIDMRGTFDKIFVSSANWHPQKRLHDNIEFFRQVRQTQFPNSCLIVLGNNPDYHVADKGIFYAGSIRHDLCAEVYAVADWMIHLAWLDHCPNSVIEAISQGCPVVCSSEGGTKELVSLTRRDNGITLLDKERYDFSLVDYDNPPRMPLNDIPLLPAMRAQPYSVDIVKCAKKYEDTLLSVLNEIS